jgi:hypothetical protein
MLSGTPHSSPTDEHTYEDVDTDGDVRFDSLADDGYFVLNLGRHCYEPWTVFIRSDCIRIYN